MAAQEQLGVIEIVEILKCVACAEFDAADLLQIDEVDLLGLSRLSAELEALEALLDGCFQLAVEHGRRGGEVDLIVTLFCCVVHDASAVYQQHHLVWPYDNAGAVGNDVRCALAVAAALAACDLNALCHDCGGTHVTSLDEFQPGICQCTADCADCCTNNTHN